MHTLIVAALASVASLINLNIGNGDLRFSLGVIIFVVALYFDEKLDPIYTGLLTGIMVFLMRLAVGSMMVNPEHLVLSYLLEIVFYLAYGLIFSFIVGRARTRKERSLIGLLVVCDLGANTLELFARFVILGDEFKPMVYSNIIISALVRSLITWLVIKIIQHRRKILD